MVKKVWGLKLAMFKPQNDNSEDTNWLNAKALYDEAYEHLRLYKELRAQAEKIDLACRRSYAKGVRS